MVRLIFLRLCVVLAVLTFLFSFVQVPGVVFASDSVVVEEISSETETDVADAAQTLTLTKGQKVVGFLVIFTVVFVATAAVSTRPARKRLKARREVSVQKNKPDADGTLDKKK